MEKLVDKKTFQEYYRGKKVFVTGHTGFKGAWLCAWLSQLGATLKGYSLQPEYDGCLFNIMQDLNPYESIISDIRNKEKLKEEVLRFQPDYIFHLAAQPLVRRSYKIPSETFDINVIGTSNVLEAVNSLGKKCTVIIITTDKVYANKEQDVLYNESDILGGYDPYSASKACAELVVNSFRNSFFNVNTADHHKKAIASARAGNVIGGGDFSEDRIVPDIIKSLKQEKIIEVRNPDAVRPWQHVLEPLGGYLLLGGLLNEDTTTFSGAYNFGPLLTDHLTVRELVELSINKWGKGAWKDNSDKDQPHEATLLKLDISKAMKVLHWKPKLNAAQAVDWTINWYKEIKDIPGFTFNQVNEYMKL